MIGLSGCRVGSDYRRPGLSTRVPATWKPEKEKAPAAPSFSTVGPVAAWWTRFQDEQLTALVHELIAGNLTLAEAGQRIVEARGLRGVVSADRWPQIDLTGIYARAATGQKGLNFQGPLPGRETNLFGIGAMVRWELDLWGRVARSVEAADREIQASAEALRDASVSLVAELGTAYFEARTLQARLDVLASNIELLKRTLTLAKTRFAAGTGTELDVAQARRALRRVQSRRPLLERGIAVQSSRIAVLLGRPRLEAPLEGGPMPHVPEMIGLGLPAGLITRRADVRRADRRYAAAVARVGSAEAERFPRLSVAGTVALQSSALDQVFDPQAFVYSIGPSLDYPLFAGGRIESNIQVRRAQAEQARLALEQTLLAAAGEVESAAAGVARAQERVAKLAEAVEDGRRAVVLAQQLYRVGARGILPVIDAQREAVSIEDDLLVARQTALAETVRLYRALGGGWSALEEDGGSSRR